MIGFFNGQFIPVDEIAVPITHLSINRGYGAFEFYEIINGKAFYADRHLQRLLNSIKLLRLKTIFARNLEDIVNKLIRKNNFKNGFVKVFVLPQKASIPEAMQSDFIVFLTPWWGWPEESFKTGMPLILANFRRFLPQAKSTSYLTGQYLQHEIDQAGALDVLFHYHDNVLETSRGNIFIVKNKQVTTPDKDILYGVTRSIMFDIAKQSNIKLQAKNITLNEVFTADEVFVTSTTKMVMPIIKIENKTIGAGVPGSFAKMFLAALRKLRQQ